ncbi:hypothetical protein [Litoribacillus peritrichatus]|uniref:Uncharacterized protein n=1 Tax=Litoribacillus peritrichatus TaxID=718191 RepID=A0ABP7MTB4_9GAMM
MFKIALNKGFGFSLASALVLSASVISTSATASGSFGGGGVGFQNTYNLGKSVFYKKLACDDCPVENVQMNADEAKSLINKLKTDNEFAKEVTGKQRQSVIFYIERRYKAG